MSSRLATLLAVSSLTLTACAALKQNLRGQELSYRGAWFCSAGACKPGEMVKSTVGTREGTTMINTVKLDPRAGMVFTAAAPFDSLTAAVSDCKGTRVDVPAADIAAPGKHGLTHDDAKQSWVVWIDAGALAKLKRDAGKCAVWTVEATATWSDGTTYALKAGLDTSG